MHYTVPTCINKSHHVGRLHLAPWGRSCCKIEAVGCAHDIFVGRMGSCFACRQVAQDEKVVTRGMFHHNAAVFIWRLYLWILGMVASTDNTDADFVWRLRMSPPTCSGCAETRWPVWRMSEKGQAILRGEVISLFQERLFASHPCSLVFSAPKRRSILLRAQRVSRWKSKNLSRFCSSQ